MPPSDPTDETPLAKMENEFARVTLRRVRDINGERLEIASPRWGTEILLDPVELECLTWQTHDLFTDLLREQPTPSDTDSASPDR